MINKIAISSIPVLGILTHWISWRLKIPSILLLLIVGFLVGPVFGFLDPDALLQDMLFPIVSLSVAIILFEGGLSLKVSDLKHTGIIVRSLITTGVFISCSLISMMAYFLLDISLDISILMGAILVVTGPTVILPLLKQIQVKKSLGTVLRWEGIMIDPVGATLAVLVYEVIKVGETQEAFFLIFIVIIMTILVGFFFGVLVAFLLMFIIKKRFVPLYLQEVFTLVLVIFTYCLSDYLQSESGLLAVTVMGIVLANQRFVVIRHIITFKENLSLLLLTSLFIILAARINVLELVSFLNLNMVLFLIGIIFIVRPFVAFVATFNTALSIKERLFIGLMAPRGIVAAAVASLFGLQLTHIGVNDATALVPVTFIVIVVTVTFYGLFGNLFSQWLNLKPELKGVMFVGAHDFSRQLCLLLKQLGVQAMLVDINKKNVVLAKQLGLQVIHSSVLSKRVLDEVELGYWTLFLAMTPSDKTNLLSVIEYSLILGEESVYRLCPSDKSKDLVTDYPAGRLLFGKGNTFLYLSARLKAGAVFKYIYFSDEHTFSQFRVEFPGVDLLFVVTKDKKLLVFDTESSLMVKEGNALVYLG